MTFAVYVYYDIIKYFDKKLCYVKQCTRKLMYIVLRIKKHALLCKTKRTEYWYTLCLFAFWNKYFDKLLYGVKQSTSNFIHLGFWNKHFDKM